MPSHVSIVHTILALDLLKEDFWQLHADVFEPEGTATTATAARAAQGTSKGKRKTRPTKVEVLPASEEDSPACKRVADDNS